ncbi:Methyltransferase domain-containing protein [Bosea lupini]|jgi:ubiquinone/menaquinone biosynthesis C-methylase UbiE|uniref:Methyltransferase domain-containing protein n=1 Tax=Bosea lupini TaxID=1036779 RepID=A0A1H7XUY0_9HYPH|nr:class I SAM-dependent methyltransferase [Bosea lupini]SEM37696.1 Methyltransferase domain-containing protein [Bosea lupini]
MVEASDINTNYEAFYSARSGQRVYPTEFVVRIFLAQYPNLDFSKPKPGAKILDIAFGDGRNTAFLCEQGFDVSGIEITQGIVDQTHARMTSLGHKADLRVGRNSNIPFNDDEFDVIVACSCCYYCDEGESMHDNLNEYARVLKKGGILIASVADSSSFIFDSAEQLEDGSFRISRDPYNNRVGYRLHGFSNRDDLERYFSVNFKNFSVGQSSSNYFGIHEKLFWVVCQKL